MFSWQTFDENPTLEAVLRELVVPAIQTKEVVVRERGLTALGLCCMIHKVGHSFE